MATHPDDYYIQLQNSCLRAGVKVVYTPCIKKAPISGCSRWLGDTPLIQLSGRYKRNDIFWFTFFHEAPPNPNPRSTSRRIITEVDELRGESEK